jgi:hypothetical protein
MSRIASGGADDSGIVDVDARTTTVDASTQIDRQHLPIVIDCIQHALADADYHDWQMPGSTVDYRNRTAPQRALLRIVDKWRRENASLLSTNAATLSLDANEIIITDFCNIINHPDLIDVAASSNLSSKWGRIVTMLAFAGVMAVRCVRADHVDVLRTLADRTADRLRDILSTSNTSNESWVCNGQRHH